VREVERAGLLCSLRDLHLQLVTGLTQLALDSTTAR